MIEAGQYIQTLTYKGKSRILFYKDPRIKKFDDSVALKIFDKKNPGVDIE